MSSQDRATGAFQDPETLRHIDAKLEELRKRLLDFTRRNPLVDLAGALSPRRNTTIRVVDEFPNVLAHGLASGRRMQLVPLPGLDIDPPDEQGEAFQLALIEARQDDETYRAEMDALDPDSPDLAERELEIERALKDRLRERLEMPLRQTGKTPSLATHARNHGISPDFILPEPSDGMGCDRHDDDRIQTLLLPERFQRVTKSIMERSHSYERETGLNVLHAAFGLLEWQPPNEQQSFISPLLLLEIRMERRKAPGGAEFHVSSEAQITLNTTLCQKLEAEHGIALPEFPVDSTDLDAWFAEVAALTPAGLKWRVRREIVFSTFPSSRIAMYHDLDPAKRPIATNLAVARLLASAGGGAGGRYAEVYDTDAPEVARKVPHLVMDADASQYSALVDIADGKDLALEGPPGSGKSQTIVNTIAAALRDGKKVLFVAEKLTALDVVRNRLEAVGLGEFILPLQASKGSRDQVYESLRARLEIAREGRRTDGEHADRARELERRRAILQAYLDALGQQFGSTGLTVYDAIGHAIATADDRRHLPKEVRRAGLVGCENLTPATRDAVLSEARTFADRFSRRAGLPALWRAARGIILDVETAEDLADSAGALARELADWTHAARRSAAAPLLGADPLAADMRQIVGLLERLREETEKIDPDLVDRLRDQRMRSAAMALVEDVLERRRLRARLARSLANPDRVTVPALQAAAAFAVDGQEGLDPAANRRNCGKAEEARRRTLAVAGPARALVAAMPEAVGVELRRLADIGRFIAAAPAAARELRAGNDDNGVARAARLLVADLNELHAGLERVLDALPGAAPHRADADIRAHATCVEEAGIFRAFSPSYRDAMKYYRNALRGRGKDRKAIAAQLHTYADWQEQATALAARRDLAELFGDHFGGFATSRETILAIGQFYEDLGGHTQGQDALRKRLETADLAPLDRLAEAMDGFSFDGNLAALEELLSEIGRFIDRQAARAAEAERHLALFAGLDRVGADEIAALVEERTALEVLDGRIEASDAAGALGDAFLGVATDIGAVGASARTAELVTGAADRGGALAMIREGRTEEALEAARGLVARRDDIEHAVAKFGASLNLPEDSASAVALFARREELERAAADHSALMQASHLRKAERALRERGFSAYLDWLALQDPAGDADWSAQPRAEPDPAAEADRVVAEVRALMMKAIADRAREMNPGALSGYTGEDYAAIRKEIAAKDRQLIEMSRKVVRESLIIGARPLPGNGIGPKSSFTEMALIEHELSKRKRRAGVRELTRRAGQALQELKPCWMMSPLAVSTFLTGSVHFDLVVIDEASQMTPENAIGAISRAAQVVVVGDTKQLPPTNFFMKMISDDDVEEDLQVDAESILDMANATFSPVRQLRWHYRSRHSGLIRFSNKWMYGDNLTIFPSASEVDPQMGVRLAQTHGIYSSRTNHEEARAVIAATVRFMEEYPNRSLGVVTMNTEQRELLLQEFERERDRNPKVDAYVRDWEERNDALEEFFIKNIETIQGDERDVIFISTLYGPQSRGGRTMQRFGPIAGAQGHRRLNVLFTRAKEQIVTFTSMQPSDILADGKSKGVQMFRAWLEYAATGGVPEYQHGGGHTESPFEDHVARIVESLGCEAVPQVGASGYRIDIGVRHPDWPHGFILGVECDGATYHSSKSSRDRDRLRQEVLEDKGWTLYRIWSTDWFRDPKTEIARLKKRIEERLAELRASRHAKSSVVSFEAAVQSRHQSSAAETPSRPYVQSGTGGQPQSEMQQGSLALGEIGLRPVAGTPVRVIGIGSKVTVEKIADGRKMSFVLSKDRNDPDRGFVAIHTPLGEALLEAEEGEKVSYVAGSYVHEVRVLSVG
jgi:tetratricopeptide (TPR) repeat protein